MKKILALSLVCVMLSLCLCGCGGGKDGIDGEWKMTKIITVKKDANGNEKERKEYSVKEYCKEFDCDSDYYDQSYTFDEENKKVTFVEHGKSNDGTFEFDEDSRKDGDVTVDVTLDYGGRKHPVFNDDEDTLTDSDLGGATLYVFERQ